MPPLTRWFAKTALIYLVATFVAGILLATGRQAMITPVLSRLMPVYYHLFMVGWASQLIFGIIYWMFPVYTREAPRRSARLGWASYALLNAGLLLLIAGQAAIGAQVEPLGSWLLVAAATLLCLAAIAFVVNSWGRIRGR